MLFGKKETATLQVDGMHCVKCQARVENALKAVAGVGKVTVSLENGTATVEYRVGKTTPEVLAEAVNAQGFNAQV